MMNQPAQRNYYMTLAIGQIWLTLVSTFFVSIIWVLGRNTIQIVLLATPVACIGLLLFLTATKLLRNARLLPEAISQERGADGRMRRRRFGMVVLAEIIIIGGINIVLANTHHAVWITPTICLIVGLHFLPLAFILNTRPYLATGLLWVLVALTTWVFVPSNSNFGQGLSGWVVLPLVGCGLATWATIIYILIRSSGYLRSTSQRSAIASNKGD
jgi:hypothetical protein